MKCASVQIFTVLKLLLLVVVLNPMVKIQLVCTNVELQVSKGNSKITSFQGRVSLNWCLK